MFQEFVIPTLKFVIPHRCNMIKCYAIHCSNNTHIILLSYFIYLVERGEWENDIFEIICCHFSVTYSIVGGFQ